MNVKLFLSNTYDMAATAVFRELAKHTGIGQHNVVLVPDKYTLSVESKLLERLRINCTFDIEVMSFTRLAAQSMRDKINRCLTPEGSVILLRQAVQDVKDKLTVYKSAADGTGFPREAYAAITAMRNGGIFPHDLLSIKGGDEAAAKLNDIGLIYDRYLALLENRLSDSSTRLYAFADSIPLSDAFSNVNFFITDFADFTAPQYDIIDKLIACARSVNIGLIDASDAPNNRFVPARPLRRIKKMCAERDISPDITRCEEEIRSGCKRQLADNLFSYEKVDVVDLKNNEIVIFAAPNADVEIENIAKLIRRAVVEKNMRYKDFAVVVSDAEGYKSAVKNTFGRYDIPYFFDDKLIFLQQPAAKYILSAMKCAAGDYDNRNVNELIKNPFFYNDDAGYEEVEDFENFVLENSLSNKLKKPFSDEVAERVRAKIISTVSPFAGITKAPALTIAAALENFAAVNGLREKSEAIAENGQGAEARATAQIYDKFTAVLDEMKITLTNDEMTLNDFIALTEGVFGNIKIALVPLYLDSVYVGEPEESRYDDVKNLFIAGAIEGKLPRAAAETAVVGFAEEAEMIACGLEPYPTKKETVKNNCFSLIQLLLKPSEQLIISYPENFGGEVKASALIKQLTALFTDKGGELKIRRITDARLDDVTKTDKERAAAYAYKFATLKNGLFELLGDVSSMDVRPYSMAPYDAMAELLPASDREKLNDLLAPAGEKVKISGNVSLDRGYFSASQMEAYFACPYKQYFRYALTVKPRKDGKLRTLETGTLSHYVMEKFVSGGYYNDFDETKVAALINGWLDERIKEPDMACYNAKRHLNTIDRLRSECLQLCIGIARQITQSQFKPYLFEAKIGNRASGSVFDGMSVEIDGKKFNLHGSIDRIDECDGYFTVVDYKSSGKSLRFSDVYNGTKIQPLLYLSAVEGDDKLKYPAGLLYQPISVGYAKENDGRFTMKGILIDDVEVLKLLDTSLDAGIKSDFLPVKLNNDGTLSKTCKSAVPDTVLTALKLYAEKLAAVAVEEIYGGNVAPAPIEGVCKFCDYTEICRYENDNKYMRLKFPKIQGEDFIRLYNGETVGAAAEEEESNDGLD